MLVFVVMNGEIEIENVGCMGVQEHVGGFEEGETARIYARID